MCLRIASSKSKFLKAEDIRWLFHILSCIYFVRVLVWHVSAESANRSSRKLFGGFFRYLTINSFTVQAIQLTGATLVDQTRYGTYLRFKRAVDNLSCACFVTAALVTTLYYSLEYLFPGSLNNPALGSPVPWIDSTVHLINVLVALADIMISHPRRFNPGSFGLTTALLLLYGAWILFIKFHTGIYPYGFLNKLPHPKGIIITSFGMAVLGTVFFFIGKKISAWSAKVLRPDQIEDLDYDPKKKVDSKLA